MDKKLLYESPTVDVFAVQTEGVVCQSEDLAITGWQDGDAFPIIL